MPKQSSSTTFTAVVCSVYGEPENLKLQTVAHRLTTGTVRLAVKAIDVNPADIYALSGRHQNTSVAARARWVSKAQQELTISQL